MPNKKLPFEEFFDQALDVLVNDPFRSKFVLKYAHKKQLAVLKVTDGKKILLCKLTQKDDFEKLEKFIQIVSKILSNSVEEEPVHQEMEIEEQGSQKKNKKKEKKKGKN